MSDFMTLSKIRQSCRNYQDKPIDHAVLEQIISAAQRTPSACNSQPWQFVVVESPDAVSQVAKAGQQLGINAFLDDAKAFVIILEQHAVLMAKLRTFIDSQYFAKGDIGAAAVTVCYAAADAGVGSCIIGLYDRGAINELLDQPKDTRIGALIALGYPKDDTIRDKVRKDQTEAVRFI